MEHVEMVLTSLVSQLSYDEVHHTLQEALYTPDLQLQKLEEM